MAQSQSTLVGCTLKNRYAVQEPLGAGGMGSVYLGLDKDLNRPVVIKVPHATFLSQPGFLIRFQKEIGNLLALEHKNVVKVIDAGVMENELPYLVLQFLRGGNLQDRLTSVVKSEDVVDWLPPIADALDFIHARGYVHRDIKPANILFDDQGHPYVADFGITKALGDDNTMVTAPGYTPGTPNYMAPEAESVNPLTGAYDQYALAVVVYQALSGAIPHQGTTPYEILNAKKTQKPVPLAKVAPGVHPSIARAVMVALEKEPRDRYPSCKSFATAFGDAHRESMQRARKRSPVVPIAAAVVALVAGLGIWMAVKGSAQGDGGSASTPGRELAVVPGDEDGASASPPSTAEPGDPKLAGTTFVDGVERVPPAQVEPTEPRDTQPPASPASVPWDRIEDALRLSISVDVSVALGGAGPIDEAALARAAEARWATALAKGGLAAALVDDAELSLRATYALKANEFAGSWMGLGGGDVSVVSSGTNVAGWSDAVGPGDARKSGGASAQASATGVLENLVASNAADFVARGMAKGGFLLRTVAIRAPEGLELAVLRRALANAKGVVEATESGDAVHVVIPRGALRALARELEAMLFGEGGRALEVESFDESQGRLVLRFRAS